MSHTPSSSPTVGKPFDSRHNSLNLIRLCLALLVLFAHTYFLIGQPTGPTYGGLHGGEWAVAAFFALSGYLIAGSAMRHATGTYLLNRAARIIPGYYVCLVIMVTVFAPITYLSENGTLSGYLTTATTPFNYLLENMLFRGPLYPIAETPAHIPWPYAWNGSLWTLYFELICYVVMAVMCQFAVVKKSPWPMLLMFLGSVWVYANSATIGVYFESSYVFSSLSKLLPLFLGGALVCVVGEWVGMHRWFGIGSTLAALALMKFIPLWGGQLAAPLLAYALLWISSWLPQPRFVRDNDLSYGTYVYAFPVQQLLAVFGLSALSSWMFTVIAAAVTLPMAYLSWRHVEQPMMSRARGLSAGAAPG